MRLHRGVGQKGFTIIEVIMFLGISAAILAVAQTIFSGKQARTQFNQGVNDFVSTVQQSVDQVSTGIYPGQGQYTCSVPQGGRPVLSTYTGPSSACIFLGNAFQVIPGKGDVYTYTVLGSRTDSQGTVVTDLADAIPEPIVNNGSNNVTLTTDYHFDWGIVVSSNYEWQDGSGATQSAQSNLVGFYNNLSTNQPVGGSGGQSITAKGYNFTGGTPNSSNLVDCLREKSSVSCSNPQIINDWKLCLASANGSQHALITFSSTPGGIASDINFDACP